MENVKCMDADDNLEIWSFSECDNDSSPEIKSQRGIVKNKDGEVIVSSFGYTDEFNTDEKEAIETKLGDHSDWVFHLSLEATLLRMFCFQGQWYLSTHKKLNAFKSRWSCKQTFGELFIDGIDEIFQRKSTFEFLQTRLPEDKVYFFLVRSNSQNRIVCHTNHIKKNEQVLFLGFSTSTEEPFWFYEKGACPIDCLNQFESPEVVRENFASVDDMLAYVQNMDPFLYQGLIGFKKNGRDTIKIMNTEYQKYYRVRGNNPNLRFRYLEVRRNPEQLQMLYVLYPKYTILFDEYESTLFEVARMIHFFYVNRYIKNQYVTLPKEEYILLKKCHQWYLQDRKNNRIFTQKVLEFLGEEPALNLYKMIRRFHLQHGENIYGKPIPPRVERRHEVPVFSSSRNSAFLASNVFVNQLNDFPNYSVEEF